MSEIVIGWLIGFLGHQTEGILERWEKTPARIILMTRYVIGVLIGLPVFMMIRRAMGLSATFQDACSYVMTFATVGVGVAIGHVMDDMNGE